MLTRKENILMIFNYVNVNGNVNVNLKKILHFVKRHDKSLKFINFTIFSYHLFKHDHKGAINL